MSEASGIPEWTLGWRMQRALAHAGISVEQMAADLGVSRSTISRWLNDRGAPPRAAYVKLWALRCGVPYDWLSGDGDPRSRGGSVTGFRSERLPFALARMLTLAAS